jgi:prefoldin beta subunit
MVEEEISPQVRDQINRLQEMRVQLQMIMQQRQQIELRLKETDDAIGELEKIGEKTPIYKSVGAILIKSDGKNNVIKELKENRDTLELRKNTLEKQEGRVKEKLNELQSKVQNALNVAGTSS